MIPPLHDAGFVRYGGAPGRGDLGLTVQPPLRVFVYLLLCVLAMLFVLLAIAYLSRSGYPDWLSLANEIGGPLADPSRLWINTALLAGSGIALQVASGAASRRRPSMRPALAIAAVLALGFLASQLWVWNDLAARGFSVGRNPANSFFYLITGLHGLHLAVGLGVLAVVALRTLRRASHERIRQSLALCGVYWHFLLVVWLAMFALLASPPATLEAFAAFCGMR